MTKGDIEAKRILTKILREGCMDENPRPHYEDFVPDKQDPTKNSVITMPAFTKFINHEVTQYNYQHNECPVWTLRPIAWKSAIKEILWIYQMQSNKLEDLHNLGIKYWDDWDIGNGTIGCRYGETVRKHHLIEKLLDSLKNDPFGRRHILNLWQEDDFSDATGGTTKGLNPCCYETIWNCRRGMNGKLYLDVLMNQRSSDFATSVSINELQYQALQLMIAKHLGYEPGVLTHVIENVQIYDRHISAAEEIINRSPISTKKPIMLILQTDKTNFYDFTVEDFVLENYPLEKIKKENPQLYFQLAI